MPEPWIPKSDTRKPDAGAAHGRPVGAERDPDDACLALPDHGRPAGPGLRPESLQGQVSIPNTNV